jgi:hypothetical protein
MRPIGLPPRGSRGLTPSSDLRPIVLRMISTNSLAAFTAEVTRSQGPALARAGGATTATRGPLAVESPRRLEALPPPPATPLPRGSLLDLKV